MKKPQDSDIFGTKSISYAPRIINQQKIDPNKHFQSKMDSHYDNYTKKIGSSHRGAYDQKAIYTKVNQQVQFDQNYHHFRKDADLQSSIFYQPTRDMGNSRLTQRSKITQRHVPKHAYNMEDIETNFGKKDILSREIMKMPENTTQFKGNSSNVFGYDQYAERNGVKNKIDKLIPHQMEWTQHDSIRHQNNQKKDNTDLISNRKIQQIMESKSQVFDKEQLKVNHNSKQNNPKNANLQSNQPNSNTINMKKKEIPKNPQTKTAPKDMLNKKQDSTKVQIQILKGWNSTIMQDLSKYCRLNSTKIISINFEDGNKGNLILEKSKRWECITDWLRKDAKLKIRVLN